jgi:tetrahydromethanopterin S-methyltransferase subunit G
MTSQELKTKLDAANEKVEKRKNTIIKICNKLGIDVDKFFNGYYEVSSNFTNYFPSRESKEYVTSIANYKETHDEYGRWNADTATEKFNDNLSQLIDNLPKLFEVEQVAKNWQEKYDIQKNKENAPKIEVIWEFLNNWEIKAREWYKENAQYLVDQMNEFHTIANDYLIEIGYDISKYYNQEERKEIVNQFNDYFYEEYRIYPRYRWSEVDEQDWIRKTNIDNFTKELSSVRFNQRDNYSYDQVFGHSAHKGEFYLYKFDEEKLNKVLAQEKLAKYYDLCNRISAVVGEIQDASNLSIGRQHGEINGIVVGSKGMARVETISAGGYNIQCFHYRVLVHKVK